MENQNNNNYDFEDESPPSLLSSTGGWWQNVPRKQLIIGGAGAVLVILLMVSLFSRDGSRSDQTVQLPDYDVMERMQSRFERLEDRMEQIEMQLTRLPGLIHQVESMETGGNAGQIEQVIKRIQRMDQGMEEIRKETTAIKSQQQQLATRISERPVAVTTTPERKTSAAAVSYHEVKKGDTLFSIARTNGITLNNLLERNNLTQESVIKPGDRLILK